MYFIWTNCFSIKILLMLSHLRAVQLLKYARCYKVSTTIHTFAKYTQQESTDLFLRWNLQPHP